MPASSSSASPWRTLTCRSLGQYHTSRTYVPYSLRSSFPGDGVMCGRRLRLAPCAMSTGAQRIAHAHATTTSCEPRKSLRAGPTSDETARQSGLRRDASDTPTANSSVNWAGAPVRVFYERAGGQRSTSSGAVLANGTVLSHMAGAVYAVELDMPRGPSHHAPSSPSTTGTEHKKTTKPQLVSPRAIWSRQATRTESHTDRLSSATRADISTPAALALSPIVGVGSRVFIEYGLMSKDGGAPSQDNREDAVSAATAAPHQLVGGVVARVNANQTVAVLLDDNNFDLAVPQSSIRLNLSRGSYVDYDAHTAMVAWLRAAGVPRRGDREFLSAVLHLRGWTASRLYLLEASDLHMIPLISKSVRLCVLEKAEWERDHHKQMRQLLKERVKERDFRYRLTKYSGVISASMAFLGIAVAFAWNAMNFRRQQRGFQLRLAVHTLTNLFERAEASTHSHVTTTGLREDVPAQPPRPAASSPGGRVTEQVPASRTSSPTSEAPASSSFSLDTEPMTGGEGAPVTPFVRMERLEEESTLRRVLRLLDVHHPRVVVVTGVYGSGKKTLCQRCIEAEKVPALYVDVRDNEDTLRSIVRALGVENVDVCGDLLDLVAEACQTATRRWAARHSHTNVSGAAPAAATTLAPVQRAGAASAAREAPQLARTTTSVLSLSAAAPSETPTTTSTTSSSASEADQITSTNPTRVPLIVLKVQHAKSLKKVYNEAVALACDRRVCHVMVLLPLESLTMANLTMPRLDFYVVPIFNERQAFQYTQHAIDPVSLTHFLQTIGANGDDLDELFAAVHQRQLTASAHTIQVLQRATHQLTEACSGTEALQQAVIQLALLPFDEGQHTAVASSGLLRHPSLSRIVLYDPVKDAWVFRSRMYHTAARCLWQVPQEES